VEAPAEVTERRWVPPEAVAGARALNVAVVGAPNSGKSTLVNYLTRAKVSAVSPKYNTTRDRVLGILTEGATQVVFTDTPGMVPARGEGSGRYVASLVTTASESIPLADVVLFVVDAARRWDAEQRAALRNVAALCADAGAGLLLVANKVDLLEGGKVTARRTAALAAELLRARRAKRVVGEGEGGGGGGGGGGEVTPRTAAPLLTAEELWGAEGVGASASAAVAASRAGRAAAAAAAAGEAGDDGDDAVHTAAPTRREMAAAAARAVREGEAPPPLEAKLELLADEFEAAAYDAGLVGAGGFDAASEDALPRADAASVADGEDTAVADAAPSASASLYRMAAPMWPTAAVSGEGVDALRTALLQVAVPREWEYARAMETDRSALERVTDAIREQLFHHLHQEVPYKVRQVNRSWRTAPNGDVVIDQDLIVPSKRVAAMLLARTAGPLRAINAGAVADAERIIGRPVRLFLHVSVKEGSALPTAEGGSGGSGGGGRRSTNTGGARGGV